MNEWDFSLDESPWEGLLKGRKPGERISAAALLTILEGQPEEALEDAFLDMEEQGLLLDVADLPGPGKGEAALRLRQEKQFVKGGSRLTELEPEDPLRRFLEEVAATPAFGDERVLAEDCARGDEQARQQLAELGLSRVISFAEELAGKGVLLLDLIQEGSLGLWQAILNYAGGDFESYCDRCISRTLAKTVTMQARASGVGQKMRQALEDYRMVDERLLSELGRNPTLEEIALELHMTVDEASAVADTLEAARMMNRAKTASEPKQETREEEQAVEDTAYFQMRQRISELLSALDETDAGILTLRFGLEGGLPMTPEDTGRKLGLPPEEVVAREAAALSKLRNH